ncbi:MAG: hypothetical protein H7Y17_09540 [Chlorobia bacterium]|nr:hypothetical protein [Fimbriimonadaceae bacterium]
MTLLAAVLVLQTPYLARPEQFLLYAKSAVGSGVQSRVEELFQSKADATYLLEMARDRGGMRTLKFSMIPAPPGWEDTAPYWAIFHTRQDIEQDHDPVFPVLRTSGGLKLGRETPEWQGIETRITDIKADVKLSPAANMASIRAIVTLDGKKTTRAPILRLGDIYQLRSGRVSTVDGKVVEAADTILKPNEGDVVRAGSLLIPWTTKPSVTMSFAYDGVVNSSDEDKINDRQIYLTAWWTPSTGRLPHSSTVRVTGPRAWILKSEGPAIDPATAGLGPVEAVGQDQQCLAFRCDLPISYPKVIGGAYLLAAEANLGGKNYRAYHLTTAEPERGQKEVQAMANAVAFYEKTLAPFPFDHYYGFDAVGYYGIESYSHTLLAKGITLRFMSHEIGHTYFGGITPCAYVRDSWNESLTQYIDSIVYLNNSDRTLELGIRTVGLDVPLTKMPVAHAYESATYYRGAYVMRMLEDEIGREKVLEGLRAMLKDRVGKDTAWPDLPAYFEKASGQNLAWFWSQWVSNSKFPVLTVADAEPVQIERKWRTRVTVTQSGTPQPFRLRFKVVVRRGPQRVESVVTMKAPGETFTIASDFQPTSTEVEPFPHALATVRKKS